MLRRIGLTKIIWDWRDEHAAAFDAELDALRVEGVQLAGIWTPVPMPGYDDPDYTSRFGLVPQRIKTLITESARRGYAPDLWTQIGFGTPGAGAQLSDSAHFSEVQRAADHLTGLARLARGHGMCVVLTNHGGWAGEPRTLVDVVRELARRGLGNVGIGLRLQHAHHLIPDLDHHLAVMGEHLVAVMLSGADAGAELSGRLILPFGAGSRDRWVTHALLESGWQGQLVVHAVGHDDSEARLLDSLEGWEWSVDRFLRQARVRPTPRILEPTWPPGPSWAGRGATVPQSAPSTGVAFPTAGTPVVAGATDPHPLDAGRRAAVPGERETRAADVTAGPTDRPRVPIPYGQQIVAGVVSTDAAASFFAATGRATQAATARAEHATIVLTGSAPAPATTGMARSATDAAPVTRAFPHPTAEAAATALTADLAAPPTTGIIPKRSPLTRMGGGSSEAPPGAPAPSPTASGARPSFPPPAPALDPAPSSPALLLSRKARRQLREQHEALARDAAKREREAQRHAAREPERIGHRDVSIVAPDPYTGAMHALLLHLEDEGFTGAPRSFGWDDKGRHLVEFVPGMRADHPDAPEDALDPARLGRFLRDMHDALSRFEPPSDARWFDGLPAPGHELIVHQDIAPSNIVIRDDGSLVAIDWDAAGPGTRLWDLAYAAHSFAPLYRQGADIENASSRLRRLVDGYGLSDDERWDLVPLLSQRSQRMYDYLDKMRQTRQSPWIELWQRGVGTVWQSDARWIDEHATLWRAALLG